MNEKKGTKKRERTGIFGDASVEAVVGAHQVADDEARLSVFSLAARVDDDAIVRILDAQRVRDQRAFLQEGHLRQRIARSFTRKTYFSAHDARRVQVLDHLRLHNHLKGIRDETIFLSFKS